MRHRHRRLPVHVQPLPRQIRIRRQLRRLRYRPPNIRVRKTLQNGRVHVRNQHLEKLRNAMRKVIRRHKPDPQRPPPPPRSTPSGIRGRLLATTYRASSGLDGAFGHRARSGLGGMFGRTGTSIAARSFPATRAATVLIPNIQRNCKRLEDAYSSCEHGL